MDNRSDRILPPKSALALYLKLYCKRRDNKHKLIEAMKSWITLSKEEKQQFYKKYREYQINYKVKLANCLKKTHPFMKKKEIRRNSVVNKTKTEPDNKSENDIETTSQNVVTHGSYVETEDGLDRYENNAADNTAHDDEMSDRNPQMQSVSHLQSRRDSLIEELIGPALPEPACPSVRTARELFEMLKSTTNRDNSATWVALSSTQKSRYRRAVLLLKTDYIKKYKTYLENLPSRELFNYYNKYFE